ncbi:MAG TPA: DUF5329 domain-containing protein [Burkholderiaceae bacterium]|jgi:hypothetical protein
MRNFVSGLLLLFCTTFASANPSAASKAEITHLLSFLEKSGCQFNRNGSWYSPNEAVTHLQKKYQYLLDKNLISTSEDFIERAATESSMSGKPYLVKCDNAAPVESAVWFKRELTTFRKQK